MNNLTIVSSSKIKAIADSIRAKTSTNDGLLLDDMPSVIGAIECGTNEDLNQVLNEQEALIATLRETLRGKASGGGSYTFEWANVYEIEIGENSISNSADTVAYIKTLVNSYSTSLIVLMSPLTVNNQMVMCGVPLIRWRNGAIMSTTQGSNYDMFIPKGAKYLVMEYKE